MKRGRGPWNAPVQRVLATALEAPGAYTLTRDPDHGNRMLHVQAPGNSSSVFTVRYTVERRSLRPRDVVGGERQSSSAFRC